MFVLFAQSTVAPEGGGFGDLLVYQVTGFLIVLMVLCSLWLAIFLLGTLFRRLNLKDPVDTAPVPESDDRTKPPLPAASTLQVTPEVLAVMAAALHTVIQGPFKIVSVEEAKSEKSS